MIYVLLLGAENARIPLALLLFSQLLVTTRPALPQIHSRHLLNRKCLIFLHGCIHSSNDLLQFWLVADLMHILIFFNMENVLLVKALHVDINNNSFATSIDLDRRNHSSGEGFARIILNL